MDDEITLRIDGLPAFTSRLRALGADMERRIVRSGALAAGAVFKRAAKKNAPKLAKPDTRRRNPRVAGALQRSIFTGRSKNRSKAGKELIVVGVRGSKGGRAAAAAGKSAFYWRWVEDGFLARGRGQKIKGGHRRAGLERTRLKAAGAKFVPGTDFMKRAFKDNQSQAIAAFNARVEKRIERANRELNVR